MKLTLAVAALLGLVSEVDASQLNSQINQQEVQTLTKEFVEPEVTEDLDDNEEVELGTESEAEYAKMASGCWNGVKRWTSKGNSWATFNAAHASGAGKFEDAEFGAEWSSLYWKDYLSSSSDAQNMRNRIKGWKRPSEIQTSGSPSLWGSTGKPVPNGVSQRSLGDCWFLAAASALAEVPVRVQRITWNDKYDKHGAFRFYFWVKSRWYGINIDDRLPAMNYGTRWYTWSTAASKGGAWWMPLLEKAYAKLDQNYERIIGGMGYEGLRTLTGMPTTYISLKKGSDVEGSWTQLKRLADQNFPMTTPCCNKGRWGLVSGHAYTLLDVKQLSDGTKLARVRNPWSSERYTGPWSDKSSLWTDKLKKEAGYVNANDGAFFMNFKDYAEEFWGTSVALYQKYEGFQQINVEQKTRTVTYTVTNPSEQELYIVGETYSGRNFPRTCNPRNNYVLYMYDSSNKMVGTYGFIGRRGFGFIGKAGEKLPKGDYKVYLVNQSYSSQAAHVTLNFYWKDTAGKASKK